MAGDVAKLKKINIPEPRSSLVHNVIIISLIVQVVEVNAHSFVHSASSSHLGSKTLPLSANYVLVLMCRDST